MATTIAVLTDTHYGAAGGHPRRRCNIADILLLRAVHRLNRYIQPDVTVFLGDLIDNDCDPRAMEYLERMRDVLALLHSPCLTIPGNHDGSPDTFYRVFERPGNIIDLGGVRILPFIDRDEPGYNASRSAIDLARFKQARAGHSGPIVALQHVCLFPPEQGDAPYNHTDAGEIVEAMREWGVELAISGHHHAGSPTIRTDAGTFINAPALCERPFPFLVVTVDGADIRIERHELAMPEELKLVDSHIHTHLAYCNENMDVRTVIQLGRDFGLAGVGFAEHSGHLYFNRDDYWSKDCLAGGIALADDDACRMSDYVDIRDRFVSDYARFGLEMDCDYGCNLLCRKPDRGRFDFILGAMHGLEAIEKKMPLDVVRNEFLTVLDRFLDADIPVLAHPFRVFRRGGLPTPEDLFEPTAELLRRHRTAAEINFHTNEPPLPFVRLCLERGVKFCLGSDAHNLYEVGEFYPHLALLRDAGYGGNLDDILIVP